jgi:hypothetical protein
LLPLELLKFPLFIVTDVEWSFYTVILSIIEFIGKVELRGIPNYA